MLTANGFISEILECNQTSTGNLKYVLAINGQEYTLISPQELLVGQDLSIYKKGDFPFYSVQEIDGSKPKPFKKNSGTSNSAPTGARRSRSSSTNTPPIPQSSPQFPTGSKVEGVCRLTGNFVTKDKWLIYENCVSVNGTPLKKVGVARDMNNTIQDGQKLVLNSFDNGEFFMVLSESFEDNSNTFPIEDKEPTYARELKKEESNVSRTPTISNSNSYWEHKFYYESEIRDKKIEFQFYAKMCADVYMELKSDLESPDEIIDKIINKAKECMNFVDKL